MTRSLATVAVLALCAVPALGYAQTTGYPPIGAPVVTAPVVGGGGEHLHRESHIEMRKALKELENAKETLHHAAHDYNGRRDRAIALIDQAEAEIHKGLESVGVH